MSIFRLLPVSLLIAVSAALVLAQSSPEKAPVVVPSTDSRLLNSSGSVDLLSPNLVSPNPKTEFHPAEPLDRIRVGEYSSRLNQFSVPRTVLGPDGLSQDDTLCYTMRSYKVARDDPKSDSTHAAGYSTCQSATRFHVHTTEERVPGPAP
jgi:hypothetical protein